MVNRQVFARGSASPSRESETSFSKDIRDELMERDVDDIFALVPSLAGDLGVLEDAYIIPHAKGDEVSRCFLCKASL